MLDRIYEVLRNRKDGDKGFSLVELAVVIVIIGILVAIAVPIFANMQTAAKKADTQAAAANGSAIVASNIASGATTAEDVADGLDALKVDPVTTIGVSGTQIDAYCVTAESAAGIAKKGAGATCTPAWADAS